VDSWLKNAEAADAAEDKVYGADRRGDEMPKWVAHKEARLAKLRQAKAELEVEAKAKAAAEKALRDRAAGNDEDDKPQCGRKPRLHRRRRIRRRTRFHGTCHRGNTAP